MTKSRRFTGVQFEGILHQKAQRVDMGNTRGIIFDRPERYVVNTSFGQLEIGIGDWLVEFDSGGRYVIKDVDFKQWHQPQKKWWKIW